MRDYVAMREILKIVASSTYRIAFSDFSRVQLNMANVCKEDSTTGA